MISKDFLLIECANLRSVLKETLGYNYGLEGTENFYTELTTRLDFIQAQIESIDASDTVNLQPYPGQLILVSTLISRIERSCLGEYSWPFVTELKKIATAIWAQNDRMGITVETHGNEGKEQPVKIEVKNEDSPPMMFVLSEGGLAAYASGIEQKKASASRLQILTIQFPRTLKHFVLLHPILGHELGHALYKVSKFKTELDAILNTLIASSTKFETPEAVKNWLFDNDAPNDYKISLTRQCKANHWTLENFLTKINWMSWKEEILCDLIGLLMFGPSFLAAIVTLLQSLDTSGYLVKPRHPISGCRLNMMLSAAEILGYDNIKMSDAGFEATSRKFWEHMASTRKNDVWFDIFSRDAIKAALDSLKSLLDKNDLAFYPSHSAEIIEPLVKQLTKLIPPVGYKVNLEKESPSFHVDFRHILYAGWLVSEHIFPPTEEGKKPEKMDFNILNRLCEHGIMQQIAIDLE